jgi:perosamine synthetase
MTRQVRLFRPSVGEAELEAVRDVFERAWLGLGPKLAEFESAWSRFIGCKDSIGVNSATAALHLAVGAFRFPEGSKVLVPAITFASTATAVLYNNLEPVFVDVDPVTLGISLDDLERKATPDCVAVIPVHYAGHPVPMDRLRDIAAAKKLRIVEDCAHSAGGEYKGRKLGTWGDIGCFSFEEKKCMTTGDGGMICSDDKDLVAHLRAVRWVGIDKDTWRRASGYTDPAQIEARHWYYEIAELGYKYNMNDLAAAIGLVQLSRLEAMNARRAETITRYLEGMRDLKTIAPLLPYEVANSSYQMFGIRTSRRDDLILFLKKRGIATGVHYMPLPLHPLFKEHREHIPIALAEWTKLVTLPLFADITNDEIDYVLEGLRDYDRANA